ncbi:hypothetical protein ACFVU3_13675 [Streptomyces sp. NPDC058052]|uniref:hypothetical protein n=1 Tax=Streptomyces sp. NPDC058052 TaxID=3346316 RepID=UPI0036E2B12C
MFETLVDVVVSRWVWVLVGNAGTVVCAVTGIVLHWSTPLSLADYGAVQLACLACQALALYPVVVPGRTATPQDVTRYAGIHESLTLTTVCGTLLLAVFPGLMLLIFLGGDVDEPPWGAVLFSATSLILACIAGLFAGALVSDKVRARRRAAGAHGGDDGDDGTEGDADTGGIDAD